jgi:prophage DNA circulation protein
MKLVDKLFVLRPALRSKQAHEFSLIDDGRVVRIQNWPDDVQPVTQQDIAGVTDAQVSAAQAEVAAEEAAERTRAEKLRKLAEWLRTQSKDVRERFQDLQDELNATQNAFQTFKTQSLAFKKKIEGWAATKGGYTP